MIKGRTGVRNTRQKTLEIYFWISAVRRRGEEDEV